MNSYDIRLQHCVDILNTFPKDCKSLTVHVEDYFKSVSVTEEDKSFIVDIFAETVKFHKILHIVINRFYETDGRNIFHKEKNLYFVLLFFIIFRLDEIGLDSFKEYLRTQKLKDMYKFLNFVTDESNLFGWIELEWRKLYDSIFVENELMDNLKRWLPDLLTLVQEMRAILDNKPTKSIKSLPTTKPVPFDLHKPKPKRIPMPDLIPEVEKVKSIPETTYVAPDQRQKPVKKDPLVLVKEAERLKPSCADREISQKTIDKLNKIVAEREKELKFDGYKPKPAPKHTLTNTPQSKLNTATILREWKLYEMKMEKKNQELKRLEEGAFSSQNFEAWQQSLRAADLAEKISQLEKLRLGGKISYEEAILKRERLIQENKEIVKSLKKENKRRLERFAKEKAENDEKLRAMVEKIIASDGVKEAKLSVQKQKAAIAKEIAEESRRLQEEALIEAEAEMRRKMDIIAEIRALEGCQINNQKVIDPTEIAGYGLLCEMSLTELKERLILSKQKYEEELNQKREIIIDKKQQKEQQINDTLELIKLHRKEHEEKNVAVSQKQIEWWNNIDEENMKEIKALQSQLNEKRSLRQNKQNRNNLNQMNIQSKKSENNKTNQENIQIKNPSEIAKRMEQILSL